MLRIIKHRRIFLAISGCLVLISILGLIFIGFKPGIDFTGGSQMQVKFEKQKPELTTIQSKLATLNVGVELVQPAGEDAFIIKAKTLSNDQRNMVLAELKKDFGKVSELSFESIGPSIGQELKSKAYLAVVLAAICIIMYISFVFRKMSSTVSSWKMGVCAALAMMHDVLIVCGTFVFLGFFFGVQVDILFVTALLVVFGYSVNDTIVVFDRIRYNVLKDSSINLEANTELSINQTMVRSIATTVTVLLTLLALLLFGSQTIMWFIVALLVGVAVGAYSSIFVASPLLVEWEHWDERRKK